MEDTSSSVAHQLPTVNLPTTLPTSFNISHHFHTPMDHSSYLCWMNQFQTILNIHDLSSIISDLPPPSSLGDDLVNPVYTTWKKADQLVLSWIIANVNTSVQTILLPCSTTMEAWQLLERRLSPTSKIHVNTLRDNLHNLKKSSTTTILDYLIQAKTHADSLASAGVPIPNSKLNDYVVHGLGHEYKEFIISLQFHTSLSFDDLYDLLIKEDNIQKRLSLAVTTPTSDVAFTADSSIAQSGGRSSNRGRG